MPLFTVELNRLADSMRSVAWTAYLHTVAPTDADPTNGRTAAGGGAYTAGLAVPVANISVAADGDFEITVDMDFGTATADVGTLSHASFYRGANPVGYVALPAPLRTIANGDSFLVNANSVDVTGSTA